MTRLLFKDISHDTSILFFWQVWHFLGCLEKCKAELINNLNFQCHKNKKILLQFIQITDHQISSLILFLYHFYSLKKKTLPHKNSWRQSGIFKYCTRNNCLMQYENLKRNESHHPEALVNNPASVRQSFNNSMFSKFLAAFWMLKIGQQFLIVCNIPQISFLSYKKMYD
jgi:hypothetical protein